MDEENSERSSLAATSRPLQVFDTDGKLLTRWAGHVARMVQKGYADRFLMGNSKGTRPLARHKCR
jgi:hypothetical protein